MQAQYLEVRVPKDIEIAFRSASKRRADAVLALQNPVLTFARKQVVMLALKNRMPAVYHSIEFVEDGGLMTYSVSLTDLSGAPHTYVDKILKGAKARRLPGGTADEVRVHHQSKSRQANRSDDSAECAGAGGSGDQMRVGL